MSARGTSRAKAAALVFGVLFGFTLGWAGLADYDTITAMLQLREPHVFLLMGTSMATGAVGLRLLRGAGARTWADGTPVAWTTSGPTRAHIIGSMMFGTGWAIAGTCPGPALVQIGRGQISGLFIAGGIMLGVVLAGLVQSARERAYIKQVM